MRAIFAVDLPSDIDKVRAQVSALEGRSDFELQYAWRAFCEDCYCASCLGVDEQLIGEFIGWLRG